MFGRGGEEVLALVASGVTFEVVPGVSSGTAVATAAGIPLTHRGVSGSVAFVTAHDLGDDDAGAARRARLSHLARGADTLVVFMAGAELPRVRQVLIDAGLAADTPAAVIESGTLPEQRILRCPLADLARPCGPAPAGRCWSWSGARSRSATRCGPPRGWRTPGAHGRWRRAPMARPPDDLRRLQDLVEAMSAEEAIRWALDRYHPRAAFASSFGAEDVVVADAAAPGRADARIFTLDTGRLPEETHDVALRLRARYRRHDRDLLPRSRRGRAPGPGQGAVVVPGQRRRTGRNAARSGRSRRCDGRCPDSSCG